LGFLGQKKPPHISGTREKFKILVGNFFAKGSSCLNAKFDPLALRLREPFEVTDGWTDLNITFNTLYSKMMHKVTSYSSHWE